MTSTLWAFAASIGSFWADIPCLSQWLVVRRVMVTSGGARGKQDKHMCPRCNYTHNKSTTAAIWLLFGLPTRQFHGLLILSMHIFNNNVHPLSPFSLFQPPLLRDALAPHCMLDLPSSQCQSFHYQPPYWGLIRMNSSPIDL